MSKLRTAPPRLQAAPSRLSTVSAGSWRAGKTTTERGYGYRWQKYRVRFLQEHPLCAMCKALGMVTGASVVDHITPHNGDESLFWSGANHQALCKPCHDGAKQREDNASR